MREWVRVEGNLDRVVMENVSGRAFVLRPGYDMGNAYSVAEIPRGHGVDLRNIDMSSIIVRFGVKTTKVFVSESPANIYEEAVAALSIHTKLI